ncbi:MAG: AAA family ATPase, partial [Bacteroidales bacterium]|nr:AAA family ATPase [Bacteroidales bacterium]MDY6170779.1 AAA family ATPase [Candidatus Cryptobacteroides sp.]
MEQIKQIPYGVSDFRSVIERGLYYVDKSMYIEELERQPRTLIFIRPRRFGKSLFINMMRLYYDKAAAGDFERIFGGLYIGQHPTPLRNRYQVLYMDFSQIGGGISRLEDNFSEYCSLCLDDFMRTYKSDYPDDVVSAFFSINTYSGKLKLIVDNAKKLQIPLYLIIDEYDNFTNVVLNEQGEEVYHAITHADGFYRDLFKKFKGNFERIFLTGVSPVTLDDLTSGFNIGWNASTQPELDKMLGFSTADVRDMFLYYKSVGMLPANCDIEDMIEDMRPWYDNYCFAKQCLGDGNTVFNCDMVLYYLRHYVNSGHAPEEMLDNNTRTDYSKLKKLIQLDKLDGNRKGVLMKVIEEGQIVADLRTSFSAMDMTDPEVFPSLLFYYGMLTIIGTYGSQLILGIPNNNVRKQYYSYLIENYENACDVRQSKLKTYFTKMAFDGNWREAL